MVDGRSFNVAMLLCIHGNCLNQGHNSMKGHESGTYIIQINGSEMTSQHNSDQWK